MSTGQVFLTLGAITLLSLTALNVNRTYVATLEAAVGIQAEQDAIHFAQTLADEVASRRYLYDNLATLYPPGNTRAWVTPSGDSLSGSVAVGAETTLPFSTPGRYVTVSVLSREQGVPIQRVRLLIPIPEP